MIRSQQLSKGNQKAIKSTQGKANREKKRTRNKKLRQNSIYINARQNWTPPPQARVV